VAIKVLPTHLSDDGQRRERFEREAGAVSGLITAIVGKEPAFLSAVAPTSPPELHSVVTRRRIRTIQ